MTKLKTHSKKAAGIMLVVFLIAVAISLVPMQEARTSEVFTSSTYVTFWYEAWDPDILIFDSRLTNGPLVREYYPEERFWGNRFVVHDASYLDIPPNITSVDQVHFELISKPAHAMDPREAPNPNGEIGLIIVDNYMDIPGNRKLRVPVVTTPKTADNNGEIYNYGSTGRAWRYDTEIVFRITFDPDPEIPEPPCEGFCPPEGRTKDIGPWRSYEAAPCWNIYDEDGNRIGRECTTYWWREVLEMSVEEPVPVVVKAGQGTYLEAETRYYTNGDPPSSHRGSIAPAELLLTAKNSNEYPFVYPEVIKLLPDVNNPATHWNNSGSRRVTWKMPYAYFNADGDWTRLYPYGPDEVPGHDIMLEDIEREIDIFGGLQRYYTGFKVPDGRTYALSFATDAGRLDTLYVCEDKYIEIQGSPYDDFIVRTVDPRNPFPGGVPANWVGKEHYITDLIGWYEEPEKAYQQKLEDMQAGNALRRYWENFNNNIIRGIARLRGQDVELEWIE